MARITNAQLQDQLASLRHNYEQLEAKLIAAESQLAAERVARKVAEAELATAIAQLTVAAEQRNALNAIADARIARAASRPQAFPRPVFEFDPNLPGDFQRAVALARANKGIVRRARPEHA